MLAEAVALVNSVVEIDAPDIAEDRLRLERFNRSREAMPLHEVKAWVESWVSVRPIAPVVPGGVGS